DKSFSKIFPCRKTDTVPCQLFFELNAVFVRGLIATQHLDVSYMVPSDKLDSRPGDRGEDDDGDEDEGDNIERNKEKLYLDAFKLIITFDPQIAKYFKKLCRMMDGEDYYESDLRDFVDVFIKRATSAQTADTRKVKDAIIMLMQNTCLRYLIPMVTLPLPYRKSAHGFNNYDTGLLLCPASIACKYDDTFCLLLRDGEVCQHMLFGSGVNRVDKSTPKQPIADIFGITSITPELIAYVAVQAHFALSSTSQWNMPDGLFSFQDFYYNILALFYPLESKWSLKTLKFWNKIFYSNDSIIRLRCRVLAPPPKPHNDVSRLKKAYQERLLREKQCHERKIYQEEVRAHQQQEHLAKRKQATPGNSGPSHRVKHRRVESNHDTNRDSIGDSDGLVDGDGDSNGNGDGDGDGNGDGNG
ncbi:hypothetical protein C0993_007509, partial [Termitomyces sp. T159_Od127]